MKSSDPGNSGFTLVLALCLLCLAAGVMVYCVAVIAAALGGVIGALIVWLVQVVGRLMGGWG